MSPAIAPSNRFPLGGISLPLPMPFRTLVPVHRQIFYKEWSFRSLGCIFFRASSFLKAEANNSLILFILFTILFTPQKTSEEIF